MAHTMKMLKALLVATAAPLPFSPTAKAEADAALAWRPDERLALGSPHQRTRKAHNFCGGGCGRPGEEGHEECSRGCGTHNPGKCGGRRAANKYPLSLVAKNDHTMRIALGMKRQARIKARGW